MSVIYECAKTYLEKGLSVIPVNKQTKIPLGKWEKYIYVLPTEQDIQNWFDGDNPPNIGITTGKLSNITVIDIDQKSGGLETLKTLNLPPTYTVKTGGGGFHYYYKYNKNFSSNSGILSGIDIRNDGGQVVAPPSLHQSGNFYTEFEEFDRDNLADFPAHLLPEPNTTGSKLNWRQYAMGAKTGNRNDVAAKMAGVFLNSFPPKEWLIGWEFMKAWNTMNQPPLTLAELEQTYNSISKKSIKNWEDKLKFFN